MKKVVIFLAIVLLSSCTNGQNTPTNIKTMITDQTDYSDSWELVRKYIDDQLPASAAKELAEIETAARANENYSQLIKVAIFRARINLEFEEATSENTIHSFDSLIQASSFPEKNVYYSLTAELYSSYYDENSWKLNGNVASDARPEDLAAWSREDFKNISYEYYIKSLEDADKLKKIPLEQYDDIINKGIDSRNLRPTLYDFLAHRAINYFSEPSNNLLGADFLTDDALKPVDEFIKIDINDKLSESSLLLDALRLYQNLEIFHQKEMDALVNLDLARLSFVRRNLQNEGSDNLYLNSLLSLEKKSKNDNCCAEVIYSIASYYRSDASKYDSEVSDEHKDSYVKAVEYCLKAMKQYGGSRGAAMCENMYYSIIEPKLGQSSYIKTVYPDEYFSFLVNYSNCNHLYFKIVNANYKDEFMPDTRKYISVQDKFDMYLKAKAVNQWDVEVTDPHDYRQHSIEVAAQPLHKGCYAVLMSNDKSFDYKTGHVSFFIIQVTDINLIVSSSDNNNYEIYTVDRNSGKSVGNCKLTVYNEYYKRGSTNYTEVGHYTSDKNGKCIIPNTIFAKNSDGRLFLEVEHGGKWYAEDVSLSKRGSYNYSSDNPSVSFYLDRAIYRPGQTVFFKGIVTKCKDRINSIVPDYSVTVTLKDANYQNVGEVRLKTNEYGTFAGSFVLPSDGLTGNYTLGCIYSSINFRVEEYKRPTFEITFEDKTSQPKPDSKVTIDVKSETYAGLPLSNATVKYKITRETSWWSWWWRNSGETVKIASGELTTDENGIATINFTAKCPNTSGYFYSPLFVFIVHVDVTDASGETISDVYRVRVSNQTMNIRSNVNEYVLLHNDTIEVYAENLRGEEINTMFDVELVKLVPPKSLYRDKLWDEPDYYSLTKSEYEKKLTRDVYGKNGLEDWTRDSGSKIKMTTDGSVVLPDNLIPGFYAMDVTTKDDYKNIVKESFYFQVVDDNKFKFAQSGIKVVTDKSQVRPGDDFNVYISSSSTVAETKVQITSAGRVIFDDCITVSKTKVLNVKVKEEDRGGIDIMVFSTFNNRDYSADFSVSVPFENKRLNIKLLTEKNSMLPGGTEKWTLRITDYKGKPVSAELLAEMYDMSLDYFCTSSYYTPSWGRVDNNNALSFRRSHITANSAYAFSDSRVKSVSVATRSYDEVEWYGLLDYGHYRYLLYETPVGANYDVLRSDKRRVKTAATAAYDEDFVEEREEVNDSAEESGETKPQGEKSIRRDFRETAFFYPQLTTDKDGNVEFEFLVPQSITKWKFRAVAHTKDLSADLSEMEIVAKKDMFITPNYPKVLYQNDEIYYTAKISNTSDKTLTGKSYLVVTNEKGENITSQVVQKERVDFTVAGNNSVIVKWKLAVPSDASVLTIRSVAETASLTDAEEHIIPVLTTKVLITETLPMTVKKAGKNTFQFKSFNEKYGKKNIYTQSVTLEYTPNPLWYAVQTLPYFEDGDDKLVDIIFGKLYSNLIADYIVKNNPTIEEVYRQIKATNPDDFVSQLEKNQELKDILLNETPWVLDAANEQEQRERMIMLFNANQMSYNKAQSIRKLKAVQRNDGSFPWIEGSKYSSYFVTLNVISGFAHLNDLGIISINSNNDIKNMVVRAINYIDTEIVEDYEYLKKHGDLEHYIISSSKIKYLYLRNCLMDMVNLDDNSAREAYDFYLGKLKTGWQNRSLYSQALSAMVLQSNDAAISKKIMQSFDERALHSDELGMYWRDLHTTNLFDMYCEPISTMAAMIECYYKLDANEDNINEMKRWLLNQKRTTMWNTTSGTTEAVFALLIGGDADIIGNYKDDVVMVGNKVVDTEKSVPGSGYVKQYWNASEVDASFGKVTVDKTNDGTAWASLYWQYLTDYDNVTAASSGLSVKRTILKASYAGGNTTFTEVKEGMTISPTDKVVVRMVIKSDRDMEYVHLKDIVPACFIPEEVLSGYHYSGDLLYYLSIRDESMNFFIERMNKGTYMIEYKVNVQQSGTFTAGLSKIQCYYAPEFGGQSEGVRISVK